MSASFRHVSHMFSLTHLGCQNHFFETRSPVSVSHSRWSSPLALNSSRYSLPFTGYPVRVLGDAGLESKRRLTGGLQHLKGSSVPYKCASVLGQAAGAMPAVQGLSSEQVEEFNKNGFLVLEGFASKEECSRLMTRMGELLETFDPQAANVFSTKNQKATTNQYFLDSASNISFFFEEKAFDEQGNLKQAKEKSINKVGHALHDLDPVFSSYSRSPKVAALLASLGYRTPLPVQSMYIFKQPGIGGEVVPHQDNTFLYTDPPSVLGIWLALEDATKENGCLWALPGSHKGGVHKFFTKKDGGVSLEGELPDVDLAAFAPLEVPAGTLVLLHGSLIHNSYENTSSKSRHAYTLHVVEGDGCMWSPLNWLQRPEMPFRPLSLELPTTS